MATSSANSIVELLENFLKILKEEQVFDQFDIRSVIQFVHPEDLQEEILFSLSNKPASDKEIEDVIRQIIRSVKMSDPYFDNEFYGDVYRYGLIGSWLAEVLNTSLGTYENAPVFTLMEKELIQASLKLVGFPFRSEGIITPDDNISVLYAMMIAKSRSVHNVKEKGLCGKPPLACFTSDCAHYSIMTAADWLGIGTENVYTVKTDKFGCMDVNDLKKCIKKAKMQFKMPFFVNATAGTPTLGSIDPLWKLDKICRLYNMWLHVDARIGGVLLFSKYFRNYLRGIEHSSSVTWNPYNIFGVPYQCSLILINNKIGNSYSYLSFVNKIRIEQRSTRWYNMEQYRFYKSNLDTDSISIQSSRKVDAIKFWLMWKVCGKVGLQRMVDDITFNTRYLHVRIMKTEGFRLVLESYSCTTVCFWYVPPSMRGQEETPGWWDYLYTVTVKIKERLILEESLMVMITYGSLPQLNLGNFFCITVKCHQLLTTLTMDYILNEIIKAGTNL